MKNEDQIIKELLNELMPLNEAEIQLSKIWQDKGHSLLKVLKALKKRREWFNLDMDASFEYWSKDEGDK